MIQYSFITDDYGNLLIVTTIEHNPSALLPRGYLNRYIGPFYGLWKEPK